MTVRGVGSLPLAVFPGAWLCWLPVPSHLLLVCYAFYKVGVESRLFLFSTILSNNLLCESLFEAETDGAFVLIIAHEGGRGGGVESL